MVSWTVLLIGMMLIALTLVSLFFHAERRTMICEQEAGCTFHLYKGFSHDSMTVPRKNLIDSIVIRMANDGEVLGEARDAGGKHKNSAKGRKGYSIAFLMEEPIDKNGGVAGTLAGILENAPMERSLWQDRLKSWQKKTGEDGVRRVEDLRTVLLSSWTMSKSNAVKQEDKLNKFIRGSFETFEYNGSKLFRFSFATLMAFLSGSFCMMLSVAFGKFTEKGDYQYGSKDY